jgi:predicted flap endonuclease-1-like 5' DNA nuclease
MAVSEKEFSNSADAEKHLNRLHSELEDASEVTKSLYFKVADLQQQLAAAGKMDIELTDLEFQYDKLKSEEEKLKSQLQQTYTENVRYASQFNEVEHQLKNLQEQNTLLQKKFAHVEILDEEVKNAVLRNKELQQQVRRLNEVECELGILTEERDTLKSKREDLEIRIVGLEKFKKEETQKFHQQLTSFARLAGELQEQIPPLTDKIQQLQKEIYTLESWKQRFEHEREENERLRKEYRLLTTELNSLQTQFTTLSDRQQQEQMQQEEKKLALADIRRIQQQLQFSLDKLAEPAPASPVNQNILNDFSKNIARLQQQVKEGMGTSSAANIPAAVSPVSEQSFSFQVPQPATIERDDLKKITGIGFTVEKLLNEQGFLYYRQVAALTEKDINALKEKLNVQVGNEIFEKWRTEAAALDAAKNNPA